MSNPSFHIPMSIIKLIIVRVGRIINAQRPNETEPSEDFDIIITDQNNNTLGTIRMRITLERIALSPNVFGANVRIEDHFFQVPAGHGLVDYTLILAQVDVNAPLGRASIRINWIDNLTLMPVQPVNVVNPNLFVVQVEDQILHEW